LKLKRKRARLRRHDPLAMHLRRVRHLLTKSKNEVTCSSHHHEDHLLITCRLGARVRRVVRSRPARRKLDRRLHRLRSQSRVGAGIGGGIVHVLERRRFRVRCVHPRVRGHAGGGRVPRKRDGGSARERRGGVGARHDLRLGVDAGTGGGPRVHRRPGERKRGSAAQRRQSYDDGSRNRSGTSDRPSSHARKRHRFAGQQTNGFRNQDAAFQDGSFHVGNLNGHHHHRHDQWRRYFFRRSWNVGQASRFGNDAVED
jgi:hypothetical protein